MDEITIKLPPGTEKYADDLRYFVSSMVAKLHKHRDKGHWEEVDIPGALNRMHEEIDELEAAIADSDYIEIHREAADVANFALILSSIQRRKEVAEHKEGLNGF